MLMVGKEEHLFYGTEILPRKCFTSQNGSWEFQLTNGGGEKWNLWVCYCPPERGKKKDF